MTILILISVVMLSMFLFLGVYALCVNPGNSANIMVFLISLCFSAMCFGVIMVQVTSNAENLQFWYKFGTSLSTVVFFIAVLLSLRLSNFLSSKIVFNLIVASLFLFLCYLLSRIITLDQIVAYTRQNNLNVVVEILNKKIFYIYLLYLIMTTCIYVTSLIIWRKKTASKREKKQALVLMLSFFVSQVSFFIYMVFYFEILKIMKYEITGSATFLFVFWFLGIWFCIVRYRFLSLTPELVSNDLINNVDELFILLDYNKRILIANEKTKSLVKCKHMQNMEMQTFLYDCADIYPEIDKMFNGELDTMAARINFINSDNDNILVDALFTVVKDRHDDILGIMLIGKEIRGIKQLKLYFSITEREAEIIQQIIIGHNNIQIANELKITENTIKRHIANIYNKLNVNNKLELINLLKEFDLLPQHKADRVLLC